MSKAVWGALAVLGIASAAGAGYWFGHARAPMATAAISTTKAAKAAAGAERAVNVDAVKVSTAALPQAITTVGSLRSDESVILRPEVAGRISAILFKEGQHVDKGVVLVRLDPAVNQAEVQQARANQTLARSKFDRAVDLAKQNFISGQAKDEAENNLKVADAALALAEAHLAKTSIRAPFAGVIGLRSVSEGDYVKEGADMVNLERVNPLKVDFRVPEVFFSQVRTGATMSVALDAFPGKTFPGKVIAVNPLIDAAGRSVAIRAQVDNNDSQLRPGMFARVRLITRDVQNAMVVPERAIVPEGDDQFVFRVIDNKAVRTRVETGQRREAKVEIVKGLSIDDTVVIAGQIKLRDGSPVAVNSNEQAMRAAKAGPAADSGPSSGKTEANAVSPRS